MVIHSSVNSVFQMNKEYNALLTANDAEEVKSLDGIPLSKWNCSLSAAPETWDWRQFGYVPTVKNQVEEQPLSFVLSHFWGES